jgi:hypothetical protein
VIEDIQHRHKGALGEMIAISFLLGAGYEVFRNISQHGPMDLVAYKDGIMTPIDVKTKNVMRNIALSCTAEQFSIGVKFIIVSPDGSCKIVDPEPPRQSVATCVVCGIEFCPRRRRQLYCGRRCIDKASYDRRVGTQ